MYVLAVVHVPFQALRATYEADQHVHINTERQLTASAVTEIITGSDPSITWNPESKTDNKNNPRKHVRNSSHTLSNVQADGDDTHFHGITSGKMLSHTVQGGGVGGIIRVQSSAHIIRLVSLMFGDDRIMRRRTSRSF
ncbi:unnamed protein product [Pleuronectes platessa]|uniref:Uncharacterized protein n=1 Tax=Pleuronectes platessa TaxID=8262 RepID=A0A9N7VG16_PLEPL|nr:unnamed protein product [Pleuronectes platessa]